MNISGNKYLGLDVKQKLHELKHSDDGWKESVKSTVQKKVKHNVIACCK